ncbi:type II toxin-antitoxin system RelE/ParE family toxin [Candidatus Thioglobus sp.]|jgi:mRNA interferase RelE/StbE|uniref:type II toxin-antitoxin system RelE family toxin n=1 Tax=Candidatus Thioglobus sp. TaxID=2026721 RepID=UPI0001BD367C|nr:type II toxin-antitoxin system RelE/ParE family toxin [Candidatus Thioglobus sp.]EEZ80428.1 MAG: Plasmid stabilization system [uncultured Candidatus Thioglobus sp.]MBT3186247.1 type II toxin-antitoxin system RelE/ParE family toxin [Candidatus Thioglobus sp.]MBT3431638.1 type II toxin-antitoxin system RelE/ParE family toxin [Candidatus Thioglobus sp.]MBT4316144.1 type II toxin-antitoxin system RelE/ParE family toxin [Candidatus Thioglobus sp.]MBT6655980.1 type II toxin-antitoxin system RelE/
MKVSFERAFLKDITRLNDAKVVKQLKIILDSFESNNNLSQFKNIKKLKGHNAYFRIRIGNYRLGFSHENEKIHVIRFLHRKDIYKSFP